MKMKLLSAAAAAVMCFFGTAGIYTQAADSEYIYDSTEEITINYEDSENYSLALPQSPVLLSNTGEGSFNHGDNLTGNNKAVYEAMKVCLKPTLSSITIPMTEKITVSLTGLPNSFSYTSEDAEALSTAIFSSCKAGIDCFMFDYPEVFWLDPAGISINFSNISYTYSNKTRKYSFKIGSLIITPGIFSSIETVKNATAMTPDFEKAVEEFPVEGETRYEQLKSIHDYIINFTYYDANGKYASSALGALIEPGVVCEGYSKAFKLICDRLDIPCVLIFGNYKEADRTAHMWNYVQMEDGKWYAVDVTWDDVDGKDGREVKYDYFLKGSDSFFTNHTEFYDYAMTILKYPEIAENDYTPAATEILKGDFNNDGELNSADLVLCQNSLLGKTDVFCDFNGDGRFDSFDIAAMRMYLISA